MKGSWGWLAGLLALVSAASVTPGVHADVYVTTRMLSPEAPAPELLRFTETGTFLRSVPLMFSETSPHEWGEGVTVGSDGTVWASGLTMGIGMLLHYTRELDSLSDPNHPTWVYGWLPSGLATGPDGTLFSVSQSDHGPRTIRLARNDGQSGSILNPAPLSEISLEPWLTQPGPVWGMAFDLEFGPDGFLYVSSTALGAVLRLNPATGAFLDFAVPPGTGQLEAPTGIAFAPDGALLVADSARDEIVRFDLLGDTAEPLFWQPGLQPADIDVDPYGQLLVASVGEWTVLGYDALTGAPRGEFTQGGRGLFDAPPVFLAVGPIPESAGAAKPGIFLALLVGVWWRGRARRRAG